MFSASLVWRAWTVEPFYFTGLALRAFLYQPAFLMAAGAGAVLIVVAMLLAGLGPEVRFSGDAVGFEVSAMASGPWPILILSLSFFICQYCIGKWLARRAAHREWAAYLSFLIVSRVLWTAILLSLSFPVSMDMPMEVFFAGIEFIALCAGIERGRRLSRRLAEQ